MSAIDTPVSAAHLSEAKKGVAFGIAAHLVWGVMAYYFKLIEAASPVEIAVHRGLWSLAIAAIVIWALGQYDDVKKALASPRIVLTLLFTSLLIVFNWGFYIWSIQNGRTIEASLGYYINPLLNVVVGAIFLGERFTRLQLIAIAIAVIAVLVQTIALGVVPWLGLMLGATFCLYGLIRKIAADGGIVLFSSTELPELIGLCDRILVMAEGAIVGELAEGAFTEQQLLTLAMTQSARNRDEASQ